MAANPVNITDEAVDDFMDEASEADMLALAEAAALDSAWYAEDGERYEALYISTDGVA